MLQHKVILPIFTKIYSLRWVVQGSFIIFITNEYGKWYPDATDFGSKPELMAPFHYPVPNQPRSAKPLTKLHNSDGTTQKAQAIHKPCWNLVTEKWQN